MPLPNFFIVGAPKAHTDELFYDLEQHPEIYMSPLKEPCFFSNEVRPPGFTPELRALGEQMAERTHRWIAEGAQGKRFGGIVERESDYRRLFDAAREEKALGEGSVCYLSSPTAAGAIANALPEARIIVVLMDPAERAFRQYLKSLADGNVSHSFAEHLDAACKAPKQFSPLYPFLELGEYSAQVQRFMFHFPAHQLHISFYEDATGNEAAWFRSVLRFLGVDEGFRPQVVDVPSRPKFFNREEPVLKAEERERLVAIYRDDVLKLQDLIERDLSAWLR